MITLHQSRGGMSSKWDERFIDLAKHISQWSKDPSTKVGFVVIGEDREIRSTGFNATLDYNLVALRVNVSGNLVSPSLNVQ